MIPEIFKPTPYYTNETQARLDRAQLFEDSKTAYFSSRNGDCDTAKKILTDWSIINKGVGNEEGMFLFLVRGHLFIKAYMNLLNKGIKIDTFENWVNTVFKGCANNLNSRQNNYGAWAILGSVLVDKLKGNPLNRHFDRISRFIQECSTIDGVMWREAKRTNSGIFYSYFCLAPLLEACYISNFDYIWLLYIRLGWLFQYAVYPQTWPYKPKKGLAGLIESWLYPHADTLEMPHCWGWPGNLYKVAGEFFSVDGWKNYACMDQFPNEDIFLFGEFW
jgi:Alginate lyase